MKDYLDCVYRCDEVILIMRTTRRCRCCCWLFKSAFWSMWAQWSCDWEVVSSEPTNASYMSRIKIWSSVEWWEEVDISKTYLTVLKDWSDRQVTTMIDKSHFKSLNTYNLWLYQFSQSQFQKCKLLPTLLLSKVRSTLASDDCCQLVQSSV